MERFESPDELLVMAAIHVAQDALLLAFKALPGIAAFMGVPLSTVKWRIHHGKKLLRTKVESTN
ncbi:MAG TPA: hypothetical protein VF290_05970 [Pyrinomonadaceae bacterium]